MTADVLYWQSYGCGCISECVKSEAELPKKCEKHEYEWLQRYVSRKLTNSVEQIADNEPDKAAGVTHQNQIIARIPPPVLPS